MGKSLRNISDSNYIVSDDLSLYGLSLRVIELENTLCIQDKLLCKVFYENKKLNLELESASSKIASLRFVHDDMSAKSCDNCIMIMVNYADLWLVRAKVASQFDDARLELRELKAHSMLFGACITCHLPRSNLEASAVEIKDLKHQIAHSFCYSVLSHPCEMCGSIKGKLFHATKENTKLKQEIAYLTERLEKIVLSEKIIEADLSEVEDSATKSTYKLGICFERCEDKGGKSAPKFIPSSNYHQEEKTIKSNKAHYPSNPNPSFNPKGEVKRETFKPRDEAFVCMFCGRASHLDEFCFRRKIIGKMHFEYARNSYRDEFFEFLPHCYSRASPRTSSRALP
jgi:hypothetical protein